MLCLLFFITGCNNKQPEDVSLSEIVIKESESTNEITESVSTDTNNTFNETESFNEEQRIGYFAKEEIISGNHNKAMIQIGNEIYVLGEVKVSNLLEIGGNLLNGDDYYSEKVNSDYMIAPNEQQAFYCEYDKCYFKIRIVNTTDEYIGVKDCIINGAYMNINGDVGDDSVYFNVFLQGGIGITDSIEKVKEKLGEPEETYDRKEELRLKYVFGEDKVYIDIAKNYGHVVGFDISATYK